MIDSFDGANYLEIIEGKLNLIRFSSIPVNSNLLEEITNISAAKSNLHFGLDIMHCERGTNPRHN